MTDKVYGTRKRATALSQSTLAQDLENLVINIYWETQFPTPSFL